MIEYKLVPVKPTVDMVEAGSHLEIVLRGMDYERAQKCWAAMLAAAPAPDQQVEQEPQDPRMLEHFTCRRVDNAGCTPGFTLYFTKMGAHHEYQLYRNEAAALHENLGKALDINSPSAPDVSGLIEDYPMQPVVADAHGRHRFKENRIVRALVDHGEKTGFSLNEIAVEAAHGKFSSDEQMQLAQLIGYSVSGYGTLSFVTDESYSAAEAQSDALSAFREQQGGDE